jgi:predicted GH43/DUF377 family glycosyl hydrolase
VIKVNKLGIVLSKTNKKFENEGVLNPAVIKVNNTIHLFYRAVSEGNHSSIGYCKMSSPLVIDFRKDSPLLFPEHEYELKGMEDPRIVEIEGVYYMSYTAFDGVNALGALATSTDLINWEKKGIIVPQITYEEFKHYSKSNFKLSEKYIRFNLYRKTFESKEDNLFIWDKNLILFPRKINNKFCFLHRIKPDIQIVVEINDLKDLTDEFWHHYFKVFKKFVIMSPKFFHEMSYIGSGCPPIETSEGWLLIYHGVSDSTEGYVYSACAALLDLEDPKKEISRLPYPLFSPVEIWELKGEVNNVCFPTGTILDNDNLYIYYGAADERIAVAMISLKELLAELKLNPTNKLRKLTS